MPNKKLDDVKPEVSDTLTHLYSLSLLAEDGAGTLRVLVELLRERFEDDRCVVEVMDVPVGRDVRKTIIVSRANVDRLFREGLLEYEGGNPQWDSPFYFTPRGLDVAQEQWRMRNVVASDPRERDDTIFDLALLFASNGMLMMNVGALT